MANRKLHDLTVAVRQSVQRLEEYVYHLNAREEVPAYRLALAAFERGWRCWHNPDPTAPAAYYVWTETTDNSFGSRFGIATVFNVHICKALAKYLRDEARYNIITSGQNEDMQVLNFLLELSEENGVAPTADVFEKLSGNVDNRVELE
jgi:hypothetical protein